MFQTSPNDLQWVSNWVAFMIGNPREGKLPAGAPLVVAFWKHSNTFTRSAHASLSLSPGGDLNVDVGTFFAINFEPLLIPV